MTETDLAYCAGVLDGEGCLRIKRTEWERYRGDRKTPGYHACISVRMVSPLALQMLSAVLGGTVRKEKAQVGRRAMYSWTVSDQKAEDACRALLPYLRVKCRQAELLLQLREFQRNRQQHMTKVIGHRKFPNSHGMVREIPTKCLSDEYVEKLHELYEASRMLNLVGDMAATMELLQD